VSTRASIWNLLLSLGAFFVFMVVLVSAAPGAIGTPELLIWLAVLTLGIVLIVRRFRKARVE
jgi:uncharacterized membrane protein YhaH (DUF805 family)